MAGGKKARAQAAVTRASKKGTQPGRKAGARSRVAASLELSEATSKAFWDAALHRDPPALRTSFGNYTVANVATRFTLTASSSLDLLLVVPWTSSPLAAFAFTAGTSPVGGICGQYLFNAYTSSTPVAMRPLRMSMQLKCTSSATTASGSVRVVSLDTNAIMQWFTGALRTDSVTLPAGTKDSLRNLVNNSPDTVETSAMSLLEGHTYVSCPASYTAYNHYTDFVDFANVSTENLASGDLFDLAVRPRTSTEYLASTTIVDENWLGDVPPMRWFIVMIPAQTTATTYRVQINRQDGCRYPANSLGACFSHESQGSSEDHESRLLRTIATISRKPSIPVPSSALANVGERISSAFAGIGAAAAGALAMAQRVAPIAKAALL